jgi:CheY-like chemotaxis protein
VNHRGVDSVNTRVFFVEFENCIDDVDITLHRLRTIRPSAAKLLNAEGRRRILVSRVRVLVVDDYAPFRRFVSSTLGKNRQWQIIGEASDGLEAVQKAEELQPDLIILDVGLPTVNGIEAARRIRKLCPECKILFLSQECSPDVVQEAMSVGAQGYVVKSHAGSELVVAVDAVCQGRQFVTGL